MYAMKECELCSKREDCYVDGLPTMLAPDCIELFPLKDVFGEPEPRAEK